MLEKPQAGEVSHPPLPILLLQYLRFQLGVPPDSLERILKQHSNLLRDGGLPRMRAAVAFLYSKLLTQEEVVHVVSRVPKVGRRCW